ncbi:phage tail sheath family protein [Humitalea sp. 24SJ18S-53]|uniref:phage tail sheath family protein n=1 Tax=Humitalea sp. 24SJ18S-53 TaxID=3422307 RepID=UPI003D67D1D4
MATSVSYPGVYIEELPSGVRAIAGVATSVTAFVGYTARGAVNRPVPIFSFADFERGFGGLTADAPLSYAVQQFFLNGGARGIIVRVAQGAQAASVGLANGLAGGDPVVLTATAASDGAWGNGLRLDVNYDSSSPGSLFNLTVTEMVDNGVGPQPARVEQFRNLSMNSRAPNYAPSVVNAGSNLVILARPPTALTVVANLDATAISGTLAVANIDQLNADRRRISVSIDGDGPFEFDVLDAGETSLAGPDLATRLATLAQRIETRVRALRPGLPGFANFTCTVSTNRLLGTAGTPPGQGEGSSVRLGNASQRNAAVALRFGPANGGREVEGAARIRPVQTGTLGTTIQDVNSMAAVASVRVTVQAPGQADVGPVDLPLWGTGARPASVQALVDVVQAALGASSVTALRGAGVRLSDGRLLITAGGGNPGARLVFADAGADVTATSMGLTGASVSPNVAAYALGIGATVQAQRAAVPGADGDPPNPTGLIGSRADRRGLFALEDADLFNLLVLPDQSDDGLLAQALAYATERRAFFIMDMPAAVDTLAEARAWLAAHGSLRSPNAAAYFPRIRAADPLDNNRQRSFANSGAIAGLYARTDAARGVWKAPAGTEAVLRGVQALDLQLTDGENGVLNPLGLNCLRNFPAFGPIAWGARTLNGSDQAASEWKYVPIRRLALFLEESLYRGTQWVVFEPNDEPLWAQIRLNIGAFMNTLFRQGAFQGRSPREAYFVRCDSSTTTQADIDLGIVNIIVGFAPLKPAEFVIVKLQQMAGQGQV